MGAPGNENREPTANLTEVESVTVSERTDQTGGIIVWVTVGCLLTCLEFPPTQPPKLGRPASYVNKNKRQILSWRMSWTRQSH